MEGTTEDTAGAPYPIDSAFGKGLFLSKYSCRGCRAQEYIGTIIGTYLPDPYGLNPKPLTLYPKHTVVGFRV